MTKYYFLAALLPELEIGHVPLLGTKELKGLFQVNLSKSDQEVIKRFLRLIDVENFRAYWSKEPLDQHGNLNESQIEKALIDLSWPNDEEFPDYFLEFLEKYHSNEDRVRHFSILMSRFLQHESEKESGFLAEFFTFQREFRLVMVGFRAKTVGRDLMLELQYEDAKDPIVAQIIGQKDAKVFEPPFEYQELKPIFLEYGSTPLELYKALYEYQFRQIVERWGGTLFAIERIMNYFARLLLVEKWQMLDVQRGIEIIDSVEGNCVG